MTVEFGNLTTPEQWSKLESHLKCKSYITGFTKTQDDTIIYNKITVLPNKTKYPCTHRWFTHVSKFSEIEMKSWPTGVIKIQNVTKPQDDDDFDVFGEETEEDKAAAKKLAESKKVDTKKKEKKPIINKSTLVIEVKPNNSETNLDDVTQHIRKIEMEGLTWSKECKSLPVAFGLFKLQIGAVIVDDLVNTDEILEKIEVIGMSAEEAKEHMIKRDAGDDYDDEDQPGWVQSAEIVSFQKL